jgi:predicted NBD/HSP70 family sugar kinase
MNGARIVDGTVDANAHGFEIGRQIIDIGATFPFRRSARSLESLVSGAAMERRYKRPPYHITSACVWDAAARLLAYGVHNTVAYWSPDIVVIGGSMMKTPGISLTNVRRHLKKMPYALPEYPPIRNGKLGDVCGLYGALALARNGQR